MEKFTIDYSTKNIPTGNKQTYMTRLYDMTAKFLNRMRWKAYHFKDKDSSSNDIMTEDNCNDGLFTFPSKKSAPPIEELSAFENDLYDMIRKIKFRRYTNNFQESMKKDIKEIKKSKDLIVAADKTSNFYKIKPNEYSQLIQKNINKDYKKTDICTIKSINASGQKILQDNQIRGKVPKYEQMEAFITLKDHKEDFARNTRCRLINPSKTHIGKVSKSILDRINNSIRSKTKLLQWKNTHEVISWFNAIPRKSSKCFIKFDVVDFYPTITPKCILDALQFARRFAEVSKNDENIILHSCQTLLFYNGEPWEKRSSDNLFDIPMGSFHGAEICELVGLLMLNNLSTVFTTGNYGLYRDDGLAVVNVRAACNQSKIEQQVRKILKDIGFKITVESGLKSTEFLDVTLNLTRDSYYPYTKPGSKPTYVHAQSNHPPNITKCIPTMVNERLCRLSKNEGAYNNHAQVFVKELKRSGYETQNLGFSQRKDEKKRTRRRNIIYYHPPFCRSVKTKFGKRFRNLVKKHFTTDNKFYKIFNKNTVKISYSCLPNVGSIISSHNKRLLDDAKVGTDKKTSNCNCVCKQSCPLQGECLTKNIVYEAEVRADGCEGNAKIYIGSTYSSFKQRFYGHKSSFQDPEKENSTKLSRYIWKLKRKKQNYHISWKILRKSKQKIPNTKFCNLCNLERLEIATAIKKNLLNARNELITKCPHNKRLFF